jgi:hypothetical protein
MSKSPDLGPRYFDRRGRPMELMEWAVKFEDADYRRVAEDVVRIGRRQARVSTIWLGLDHGGIILSADGKEWVSGPRQIFETAISARGGMEVVRRYATISEALAGHYEIVKNPKAGVKP